MKKNVIFSDPEMIAPMFRKMQRRLWLCGGTSPINSTQTMFRKMQRRLWLCGGTSPINSTQTRRRRPGPTSRGRSRRRWSILLYYTMYCDNSSLYRKSVICMEREKNGYYKPPPPS